MAAVAVCGSSTTIWAIAPMSPCSTALLAMRQGLTRLCNALTLPGPHVFVRRLATAAEVAATEAVPKSVQAWGNPFCWFVSCVAPRSDREEVGRSAAGVARKAFGATSCDSANAPEARRSPFRVSRDTVPDASLPKVEGIGSCPQGSCLKITLPMPRGNFHGRQ
mmetsp:Transcript_6000/g.14110  ORF Transcript_6000/g.14110 Transcript_6000/m.14110 type:complete len:164 (-) Transcript_6000:27-518(-)